MRDAATTIGQLLVGKEESATLRNRLVSGAGGLMGLRIAFSGLSFLVTVLLARLLGTAGFGPIATPSPGSSCWAFRPFSEAINSWYVKWPPITPSPTGA